MEHKIIKENIEAVILPLVHKLFNIRPKAIEEIPDDLQLTIERKPDFTRGLQTLTAKDISLEKIAAYAKVSVNDVLKIQKEKNKKY